MRPPPELIETEEQALALLDYLMEQPDVAIDTETTGLKRMQDVVLLWSMATMERRFCLLARFIPIFIPLFRNPRVTKHFTNAKFDLHMLANTGAQGDDFELTDILGDVICTLALDWLLDENRTGRHGLKECVWDYFDDRMPSFKDVFGKAIREENQAEEVIRIFNDYEGGGREKAIEYASRDAWETLRLSFYLQEQLDEIEIEEGYTLLDYYHEVEMPFTRVLYRMERRGVMVDIDYLDDIAPDIQATIEGVQRKFNATVGEPVNLRSPKQLAALFFDSLGVEPTKWGVPNATTGTKTPSVDKEVLGNWVEGSICFWDGEFEIPPEECEDEKELVQELANGLLEHRALSKFLGTYVKGLREKVDRNFRVHCSLNQHITVTGRLSSSGPNLQNIPRRNKDRFKIRDAFIADGGYVLYVADYAQLEMRIMAHLSRDPAMIEQILKGTDLHSFTVAEMGMGATYDEVVAAKDAAENGQATEDQIVLVELRAAAKAVGFGLIYGIGAVKLGKQLGLPIIIVIDKYGKKRETCPEANRLIAKYFQIFPGVKGFIKGTHQEAKACGFVQTYLGRFRRLPTINSKNRMLASQAERQAVNTKVQGTAADIAKVAMLKCEADKRLRELGVRQLLQVHDELIFKVPDIPEVREEAQKIITHHMEHPFDEPLVVPLPADGHYAVSWGEAK